MTIKLRLCLPALFAIFPAGLGAQSLPAFEVASIKPDTFEPVPGNGRVMRIRCTDGHFTSSSATIRNLIQWAWNIRDYDRLVGSPSIPYFVLEAKSATPVPEETCRLMLRTLLRDSLAFVYMKSGEPSMRSIL